MPLLAIQSDGYTFRSNSTIFASLCSWGGGLRGGGGGGGVGGGFPVNSLRKEVCSVGANSCL